MRHLEPQVLYIGVRTAGDPSPAVSECLCAAASLSRDNIMTSRSEVEMLLHELYTARGHGDLEGVCRLFSETAKFEIVSASHGNPVAVNTNGANEFRPLLTLLIRTFKISDHMIFSMIIDGPKAAVHWRANVHSKITGRTVPTEFIDIVEIQTHHISSYLEFFVPR
jgi:ketosteroid isomerase-like protein